MFYVTVIYSCKKKLNIIVSLCNFKALISTLCDGEASMYRSDGG